MGHFSVEITGLPGSLLSGNQQMEGILNDSPWAGTQVMRLIYSDEKFDVRVRGVPEGRWAVMPNFLPTLWGTAVGSLDPAMAPNDDD